MIRPITLLLLFLFVYSHSQAQRADSVIIRGRILNLTAPLYRQAPAITFTRNNLLQPQSELARQAPLQADGSFRVALPLIFPQEEVYLDYGGKVFTTFLASPGQVEITFDADSMFKARRLFYFAGVNAEANNQYARYAMEESRLLRENKRLGANFYDHLWEQGTLPVRRAVQNRADLRLSALRAAADQGVIAPALQRWARAITDEEQLTTLYEHAMANGVQVERDLLDSLNRLIASPLTLQRITWGQTFSNYATRQITEAAFANPNWNRSLPVDLLAQLIKTYVSPLSQSERVQLDRIISEERISRDGVDFLSSLYGRNRRLLDIITQFEKMKRAYSELYNSTAAEFLMARYLVDQFYLYNLDQQKIMYNHVRRQLEVPRIRQSLDELYRLEVKDSTLVRLAQTRTDLGQDPTEVLPGIWIAQSEGNGREWFKRIEELYKNKALYLVKWSLRDEASRREVAFVPALRAQLPDDVEVIYIHLPTEEMPPAQELWRQYILRHQLRGVHLYLNDAQAMQLLFRLNPISVPTFGILKPNGKNFTRRAPPPSEGAEAYKSLMKARQSH
ncbi:thioredoxin family protein [Telluribacter sp. SYSU D00476]|uniref:thioredoxin family protein n=1 Tax=Telluribacter sp. SYSU D00476 TaxID=2811430 RepID=UPI001FF15C3E|nr:thioredoxin family protein [Telluribacter sp. SYSU D00476]